MGVGLFALSGFRHWPKMVDADFGFSRKMANVEFGFCHILVNTDIVFGHNMVKSQQ